MGVKARDTFAPFIERELNEWEARARGERSGSGEEIRRLIAEIRRLRCRVGPPQIVRSPGRCGGDPTVGETRICVHHVIALAPHYSWDLEKLRTREFPDLSPEEMQLAVEYYREHREEIEGYWRRDEEALEEIRAAATPT